MKIKVITAVSTTEHPGLHRLLASVEKFNYDFHMFIDPDIQWAWGGLKSIYEWCKTANEQGYTHFLYTDGFDTIAMGGIEEVIAGYTERDAILYSGEKGCFPRADWADKFPEGKSRWKYINHGQFIAPIDVYLKEYEGVFDLPITCQEWASAKYLFDNNGQFTIDVDCKVFQSIAFLSDDEFSSVGNRLVNNITGSKVPFAHANGRSEFGWVYDICDQV